MKISYDPKKTNKKLLKSSKSPGTAFGGPVCTGTYRVWVWVCNAGYLYPVVIREAAPPLAMAYFPNLSKTKRTSPGEKKTFCYIDIGPSILKLSEDRRSVFGPFWRTFKRHSFFRETMP